MGSDYRGRVERAFRSALGAFAARRAQMLTNALIGVLVTARVSPDTAAATARGIAAEIGTWKA